MSWNSSKVLIFVDVILNALLQMPLFMKSTAYICENHVLCILCEMHFIYVIFYCSALSTPTSHSANTAPYCLGMAHLLEHVAYMGSPKRQLISGTGSRTNAYTDFHHTVFFAACPTQTPDQFWYVATSITSILICSMISLSLP